VPCAYGPAVGGHVVDRALTIHQVQLSMLLHKTVCGVGNEAGVHSPEEIKDGSALEAGST
jgi:hypothetical protein